MFIPHILFLEGLTWCSSEDAMRRTSQGYLEALTRVCHVCTDDIAPLELECYKTPLDLLRIRMSWQTLRDGNRLDFGKHGGTAYSAELQSLTRITGDTGRTVRLFSRNSPGAVRKAGGDDGVDRFIVHLQHVKTR